MKSYVSISTLAENLDMSETTVRDYVGKGILPSPTKIGACVRWRWSDVVASIDAIEGGGNSTEPQDEIMKAIQDG